MHSKQKNRIKGSNCKKTGSKKNRIKGSNCKKTGSNCKKLLLKKTGSFTSTGTAAIEKKNGSKS